MGNVKKSVAERTCHQRQYDRRVNKRQTRTQENKVDMGKALDVDLVVTDKSGTKSEKQDESSSSGNDTDADDVNIRPIYDEAPMAEVQLTVKCNIFATGQQHTEQPKIIIEGWVDQYTEQCQVKSPILDSSFDNKTTNVIHSTIQQNTTNDNKAILRRNNQTSRSLHVSMSSRETSNVMPLVDHSRNSSSFLDSKHFVCSTCQKCVFNANDDACITKLLKEVNSHKVKSHKTRNSNKPIKHKSHTRQPGRQIFTGYMFSPNKFFAIYEKMSPISDLRWKPMGKICNTVGLRWVPMGKIFTSCTSKADSKSTHGSNVDILNIHECKQTLDLSAGTSINVQKE
uniref:Uncharacterized protein n=1 Tax=Tanacetum cinerariifolium TaxID=118510 RepID=A0A6L2LH40_TANCI|nr:hypothetical protein [Tanacetum cinerariifolium]